MALICLWHRELNLRYKQKKNLSLQYITANMKQKL